MGLLHLRLLRPSLALVSVPHPRVPESRSLRFRRYVLLWHAPKTQFANGGIVRRGYYLAAGYLAFMLITYPICWACAEGANVITVDSEMIWYGILDCLTAPIYLAIVLWQVRSVDYNAFGFHSGKYVGHGGVPEKRGAQQA